MDSFKIYEQKVLIQLRDQVCETAEDILKSDLFKEVLKRAVEKLSKRNSFLLNIFDKKPVEDKDLQKLIQVLISLTKTPAASLAQTSPGSEIFLRDPHLFNDFIEYLYNYWRSFDRFVISDWTGRELDDKPYLAFSSTIGHLTNLIRGMYRDIQKNVTGKYLRIYRQVTAGAEVSTIAMTKKIPFPAPIYEPLNQTRMIRQMLLYPPLILNPPMNKRTGRFERVDRNPLELIKYDPNDWLCYPAKVGTLVILIYFHNKFAELGHSLCNLFQMAEGEDLKKKPDAIYLFGVPDDALAPFGSFPTVFYDDQANGILVGAVPNRNEFGYFGYLKKMVLTLHNIIMMKRGILPFHGALIRLILKGGKDVTILSIGDTGAGKSETLEAFR
ncbi:MAG: hypothetical protein NUV91_00135, partial [Candidatus Omnitrophica bacterium]|nr:hypothetical protein [Candidatus Omnitrophota bacterium]